jgi:hypothetical protein
MARDTFENLKVLWLSTEPVDSAAPTEAELTPNGTTIIDLSPEIPVSGVGSGGTANNASEAMLGDAFVAESPGTWGRTMVLTLMKDRSGNSEGWGLFRYRLEGWLVFGTKTALPFVDGDPVEVWHVITHERQQLPSTENEFQKFTVQMAVQVAPELDAIVGGS